VKIGILIDELAPGSTPKLIGWPIRKLAELGIEAEAIVIVEKDHWRKHPQHYESHMGGVRIRYLFPHFPAWVQRTNFRFPGMSFFSLHHVASRWFAHRAFRPHELDMIIACCQYSTFAARDIEKHCGIPFLTLVWDPSTFTARKIYGNRFGWKFPVLMAGAAWLDRYALRHCRAVITSGRFHHPHLRRVTTRPLEVLAPGCFVRDALPPFERREPVILTYDRWDIGNIPNVFLDILERVPRQDVKLTIGGFWHPESLKADFQRDVERRGLGGRVNLLGPLNEDRIMELCSSSMVHVHPVHEAFGMQTLEAAGCGCPGIIPAGSGVAELFKDGVSGFHPPAGDLVALVRCVNRIFDEPAMAERMSRAAWEIAQTHTWLDYARTMKQIVEKYLRAE
jgi:glycosyltransferase involved in cell wall biosynthesis